MTREERAAQVRAERKAKKRADKKSGKQNTARPSRTARTKVKEGGAKKRRGLLSKLSKGQRIIVLVTALFCVIMLVGFSINLYKVKAEQKELLAKNAELKEKKQELLQELDASDTKEYIKEQARKALRLMNKDEKIFIFSDEDNKKEDNGK